MIVFKCKMCGGEMELEEGATVAECPYCLTKQTLPKLDNDKRANMYDRANHFRRQNEYDKAMAIFESILQEDRTDAEAYWSLVLCRYGIEYVEDPATHKRVPTVNRVQYTSILADEDYKSALEYADFAQRSVYESEAKAIDEIQKGILAISKQEKPFDVFICYKETDANGRRTPDSVLANDLYHQLTNEGFKVFFSRITLEDKIGTAYEPYIFAALNSAKVMVVLGTKPEYFNAVWVKNEWSRYLALIRAGADKTLVPAYRDMDPYDLPEEFSHLQAQDMGKLGFMQDLIRGIKKLTEKTSDTPQITVQQKNNARSNIDNLMKRINLFLEDGDFTSADEYLNRVLDEDAEYAPAYIGKILVNYRCRKESDLPRCNKQFETSSDWGKALRFATPEQKALYESYLVQAEDSRQEREKWRQYITNLNDLLKRAESSKTSDQLREAASLIRALNTYNLSNEIADAMLLVCEKVESEKEQYNELAKKESKKENEIKAEETELAQKLNVIRSKKHDINNNMKTLGIFKKKEKAELREQYEKLEREENEIQKTARLKKEELEKERRLISSEISQLRTKLLTILSAWKDKAIEARDALIKEKLEMGVYQYYILEDKCIGCTACARKCPEQCITGEVKKLHVIDQRKCTMCGQCKEICKFDAVVIT